jgi:hypothetical protein
MIIAILLAHLVGDYILQWDSLSRWKSQAFGGILVHGAIVTAATWLFSLLFDPGWWPWALFIGVTHTLIDGIQLPIRRYLLHQEKGLSAAGRFITDQFLHLAMIYFALSWSGYLTPASLPADLAAAVENHRPLVYALGYAFLTMPAWVVIEFLAYGLIKGSAPDFSLAVRSKYASILERGLIVTLVLLGQFLLIPLVALPRLAAEWPEITGQTRHRAGRKRQPVDGRRPTVYLTELLASVSLAIAVGLILRQL